MVFNISKSLDILERTPDVLAVMLKDISAEWTTANEGADTWSVYDVIGHLIHGEKTDWIPRMEVILADKTDKRFEPFDRFAQFDEPNGISLAERLAEFKTLRMINIDKLKSKNLTEADLNKTGIHPTFGEVTLSHLLSTWTVHDLNHIAQISRVMARQYQQAVGPWTPFLGILQS